jgi:hypothetical protein
MTGKNDNRARVNEAIILLLVVRRMDGEGEGGGVERAAPKKNTDICVLS